MRNTLMHCENCGARAINGSGRGWISNGGEKWHQCVPIPESPRPAVPVHLTDEQRVLLDLVHGIRAWMRHAGGLHVDLWDPYIAACETLSLPKPEAEPT